MAPPAASSGTAGPESSTRLGAVAYSPTAGPLFATPGGKQITRRLIRNINHAPAGSVIRAATALTNADVADAFVNAAARGVKVRLVLPVHSNRGCGTPVADDLVARLNAYRGSWGQCVRQSARGPAGRGHMHMKVYAFSRVSDRSKVMLVTSQNATDNGDAVQYNDAYQSVGWDQLYDAWVDPVFPELRRDERADPMFRRWTWNASGAYVTPVPEADDPIPGRLRGLPGPGTRVHVAMSAIGIRGDRQLRIAREVIRLKRRGAVVRVVYTKAGQRPEAVRRLRNNGIDVRQFSSANGRVYVHSKYMIASYLHNGGRVHRVWMGSEEWKEPSLWQDEFVLRLGSRANYDRYRTNFTRLWRQAS